MSGPTPTPHPESSRSARIFMGESSRSSRLERLSDRGRVALLTLIMTVVCLSVGAVSITWLYLAAIDQQRVRLAELVGFQKSIFTALLNPDDVSNGADGVGRDSMVAAARYIGQAYRSMEHLSQSGEFVVAMQVGNQVEFLVVTDAQSGQVPGSVAFDSPLAKPMKAALSGHTGTVIGSDYQGATVLAAYTPVDLVQSDSSTRFGLVAKVRLDEVRAPFIHAGLISVGFAVLLIIGGAMLFVRINRRLIRRLEAGEARVRAIVETAADAIVVIGLNGHIQSCNQAVERIFKVPRHYLIGVEIGRLLPDAHGSVEEWPIQHRVVEAESRLPCWRGEMSGVRGWRRFPVDISATLAFVGGQAQYTLVMRDATGRKRIERKLIDRHQDLQKRNEELKQKRTELEGFYHMVSHELKTPLTAATEFSNLLGEGVIGTLDAEQLEAVHIIGDSCRQMAVMINDLLDSSRLENGKLTLHPQNICVAELVRSVVDSHAPKALTMGLRLSFHQDAAVTTVHADPARLKQVVFNLLSNAMKFTPSGGQIRVLVEAQAEGLVRVAVADTGPGIPEHQQAAIFQRFFQSDEVRDQALGGLGLGLSICKGLVALHHGYLGLDSVEGSGTTFWFTLSVVTESPD